MRTFLVGATLLFVPSLAHATNGNTPRTPALYPPHACMARVDRSSSPLFHFDVTIPFEDVTLTMDELADSRTFQFFALCHDDHRLQTMPNWIDESDAMRALELGVIPELPPASDVLAGNPHWAPDECVQVINAERMPISCDATMMGVQWDTTGVPAGNYVIRGYTFAPAVNLWTSRLGVVQVADDDTVAPVVALTSPVYEPKAFQQSGFRILGCMGGPEGTTVKLSWAATSSTMLDDESAWTQFAELDAAAGEIDELLVPPESAIYLGLLVRGVATAPDGTHWTGFAPGFITIYPGDDASDDPVLPPGPDACDVGGDTSGGLGDEGSSSSSARESTSSGAPAQEGGDAPGCGCVSARARAVDAWALAFVMMLWRRRRRPAALAPAPSFVQECARR
ncbi:MAG TPA: hypothetical protein VG755_00040 [Nannocystaceae bacterium]|nr:hypothetical protein [Nannocystaceae bacterium]